MSRVKRGVAASKRRKNIIKQAKGFKWKRKSHYTAAKEAVIKAGKYAYRDRRAKKRVTRRLWITRLNNAVRELGLTYRELIHLQQVKNNTLDRKVLSEMAVKDPKMFAHVIEELKK